MLKLKELRANPPAKAVDAQSQQHRQHFDLLLDYIRNKECPSDDELENKDVSNTNNSDTSSRIKRKN